MPELKAFLAGGGEMGALIRDLDWEASPLGPVHVWPQSLRSVLSICLRSNEATAVYWGPEFRLIYNDAWSNYLGARHPTALGQPAAEVMSDIWPVLEGQFRMAYREARTVNAVDTLLVRTRDGVRRDSWWSYSLIPIGSEDGGIGGLMVQARETTDQVLRSRQDALMLRLAEQLRLLREPSEIVELAVELIGEAVEAGRIGYAELDPADGTVSILRCAVKGDMEDISGTYPVPDFGSEINETLAANQTIRIDDAAQDPRLADPAIRRLYAAVDVAAALIVPIEGKAGLRAMLFAHHDQPRGWSDDEEDLLRAATDRVWQEVSRARAEAAVRLSEERYRRLFEEANDLIFTADLDQRITDCNRASAEALGLLREEVIGRSIREFVSEEGFAQTSRMLRQKLEHGGTTRHDIEVRTPSGHSLYWEINSSLLLDRDGHPVGLHAIGRDVTERRRAEDRQRLLVNELNHRVKNMLALVQGLALQSFRDGRETGEAREAFQERLAALARAHDLLTRENWEGVTLAQLVEAATSHHNAPEGRIRASGPEVTLNARAAVSLVMALHELCTNAAKYGALSVPHGKVDVGWTVGGDETLRLEWRERDGPRVEETDRRGFGFRMIERALASDLGGKVAIAFDEAGLTCRIAAPLARAGVAEAA